MSTGEPAAPATLGALARLAELDDDDRREALAEIRDALALTVAHTDPEPLRAALHAWQATASVMRDPLRRAVLTTSPNEDDFAEVTEPTDERARPEA